MEPEEVEEKVEEVEEKEEEDTLQFYFGELEDLIMLKVKQN